MLNFTYKEESPTIDDNQNDACASVLPFEQQTV